MDARVRREDPRSHRGMFRTEPGLCNHCEYLVSHQLQKVQALAVTLKDIERNVFTDRPHKTCALCDYFWSVFVEKEPELSREGPKTAKKRLSEHSYSRLTFEGYGPLEDKSLEFRALCDKSIPDTPIWTLHAQPDPFVRLKTARTWLQICQQNHEACIAWKKKLSSFLPTRLINVISLKLEHSLSDLRLGYAALSHCWGLGQPIKTTKQNLEQHMRMIDFNLLPKTFQEAIMITRELGLGYVWIDSLCIVQDDEQDWETEAASMAAIYESADLTIAAAWGRDGNAGCFHDYLPPLVITAYDTEDENDAMTRSQRICIRPAVEVAKYLTEAPLNARKWVLQERLLSLRTLTFAEDQIYWTCASLCDSEDGGAKDTGDSSILPYFESLNDDEDRGHSFLQKKLE